MSMTPRAYLNIALSLEDDAELVLPDFSSATAARRYTYRLRGLMSVEARQSKKDLDSDDPAWGTHPWEEVEIYQHETEIILQRSTQPVGFVRKKRTTL